MAVRAGCWLAAGSFFGPVYLCAVLRWGATTFYHRHRGYRPSYLLAPRLWAPLVMLAVEAAEAMAHRDEGTTPEERPRQMPKEADCVLVSPKW